MDSGFSSFGKNYGKYFFCPVLTSCFDSNCTFVRLLDTVPQVTEASSFFPLCASV